jgi:hypothetical protein
MLSGAVAQYGRASGIIQDVASQLIGQFAACLKRKLEQARSAAAAPHANTVKQETSTEPKVKPISGFALGFRILWNAILRLLGRS